MDIFGTIPRTVLFSGLTVLLLGGCTNSLKQADREELSRLLAALDMPTSIHSVTYLGEGHDRLYLEELNGIYTSSLFSDELQHIVYWYPISDLTVEDLKVLTQYRDSVSERSVMSQETPVDKGKNQTGCDRLRLDCVMPPPNRTQGR